MYKEHTLSQLKNIWDKDEESFVYCMKLLHDKLTPLEYSQWMFHYYYVNDKFEKAVDYLVNIKQQAEAKEFIDFMSSSDFDDDLCCCLPSFGACCACENCCYGAAASAPCCGSLCLGYFTIAIWCACCESCC